MPGAAASEAGRAMTGADAFERCIAAGGVAVFPADTVYGLACDPSSAGAVAKLYELKGRAPDKPAAVMFFALQSALEALPELGPRTRAAMRALLPGGLTLLVPNPERRFPLACGPDPETLGLRVPAVAALAAVNAAVLQSSANPAGEPDARTLDAVDPAIRAGADLVLDGGELPGTPSTVLDLRAYEREGAWRILRDGAVTRAALAAALGKGVCQLTRARRELGDTPLRDRRTNVSRMRIAIASDHAGYELKEHVKAQLTAAGHDVVDVGPDSDESVDYPRYAAPAARLVAEGDAERGVLVCGSGVGVSIVANKVPGVRAVNAHDAEEAQLARAHNDVNVVTLSGRRLDGAQADAIVEAFLNESFEGGRHSRRVAAIEPLPSTGG